MVYHLGTRSSRSCFWLGHFHHINKRSGLMMGYENECPLSSLRRSASVISVQPSSLQDLLEGA